MAIAMHIRDQDPRPEIPKIQIPKVRHSSLEHDRAIPLTLLPPYHTILLRIIFITLVLTMSDITTPSTR